MGNDLPPLRHIGETALGTTIGGVFRNVLAVETDLAVAHRLSHRQPPRHSKTIFNRSKNR